MTSDVALMDLLATTELFSTLSVELRMSHERLSTEYQISLQKRNFAEAKLRETQSVYADSLKTKEDAIESLREKVRELEQQILVANSAIDLIDPKMCLNEHVEQSELQTQIRNPDQEITLLRKDYDERMRLLSEANDVKLSILISRIEVLDHERDETVRMRDVNAELNRNVSELMTKLKEEIQTHKKFQTDASSTTSHLNREIRELCEKVCSLNQSHAELEVKSNSYQAQVKLLEQKLADSDSLNSELRDRIADLEKNILLRTESVSVSASLASPISDVNTELATERDILRMVVQSLESKIHRMKLRERELVIKFKQRLREKLNECN